ncbi:geranylgeranylglyceryl/heptaprenylglyceryl phosphate synthase [Bacteroidia bacterium]|nr:geranylgeranylglyceryl/heptaprenylglyceryl phosphate synthase [Bacteroidia bacterium]MDB9882060.1 geranylgeranylglyceryl/heptaprenylglyceryl phosphate synthase [Bacteroidia bacterium]
MSILQKIQILTASNQKMIAVLIDPDKASENQLDSLVFNPGFDKVDFLFVGGSLVTDGNMRNCLLNLKKRTNKPLIIFPGSPNQIDDTADSILLLSLVSGRNPDLLIGRQVESAHKLKQSNLEIMATGYILIDGGRATTVSYISGTTPIPRDKPGIAAATALASEQLGQKLIYLDCGSGAQEHAPANQIGAVRREVNLPLIVGGGIKTKEAAEAVFNAGADVVVVGNKLEENPLFLSELVDSKKMFEIVS